MSLICFPVRIAAFLFTAAAVFTCGGATKSVNDEPTEKRLVGSWEREGKVNVFLADGSGKNHDGSRFRWQYRDGRLTARKQEEDGKLGDEWSVLIVFTKDSQEYSFLVGALQGGGLQRVTFLKLDPDGRPFDGRSDADREYPPNAEALKGEGPPQESAPSPLEPACEVP
jgi:hypothetical protein